MVDPNNLQLVFNWTFPIIVVCGLLQWTSKKGLKQAESIKAEKKGWVLVILFVPPIGTSRGVVELYDLAESASLIRMVSLYDRG